MKKYIAALATGVTLVAGCKDSPIVNPTNAPTSAQLTGALTRPGLQTLVTGILAQDRVLYSGNGTAYPIITAIYARDAYRIDASEPRYVSETLGGNPDPGSFASGSGPFTNGYIAVRAENTTLAAISSAPGGVLTAAETSAALGFVQTFKALSYYREIELRDTIGVPLQGVDPNAGPGPIICKENALNYVAALLDSANTNLTSAASGTKTFPFSLPSGLTSFGRNYGQVSNFILFNRGLKGKVDVYRGLDHAKPNAAAFTAAIAELSQALGTAVPGAVPGSQFQNGPYHVFVPSGNEATANGEADPKVGLNPQVKDSIKPGDTRISKIVARSTLAGQGLSTSTTFVGAVSTNSANLARPIGILRDEELVLLRAQAYIGAGQIANAVADINSVRTFYGAPLSTATTASQAITDVLYDKRYSLLFEGPQRLVDLRAYGRLNSTFFKAEVTGDPFNSAFPIPKAEADARGGNIAATCS